MTSWSVTGGNLSRRWSALRGQRCRLTASYTKTGWRGEKLFCIFLNPCSSLLTGPHSLLTTGLLFFGVGWFSIPLGCSFIIPITDSHFTRPWFFWMHDTLTLTPKIWGLQRDAPTQAKEKALKHTVIYNFWCWHDSGREEKAKEKSIQGKWFPGSQQCPYRSSFNQLPLQAFIDGINIMKQI